MARKFLQLYQWVVLKLFKRKPQWRVSIRVDSVPTLVFPSRVGIAAGLDKNAEFFAGLALLGAGFVEVGTVTPLPQQGNPKPRVWRPAPNTLINHMGFNSVGLEAFAENIHRYRASLGKFPLIANIGKNRETPAEKALDDYALCFRSLTGKVDGFVVNLSSPNTPGLTSLQNEAFISALSEVVPPNLPVWLKFSPDLDNRVLEQLSVQVREERRLSGIVLTNTSREMAEEVFGFEVGGLSGRPLFSRSLECVSIVRQALGPQKTVVGVGGVWSKQAAVQMRRAGADLVEVYTAFVYRGTGLLKELQGLD
jgi:dihydroorotate dehydrogenase